MTTSLPDRPAELQSINCQIIPPVICHVISVTKLRHAICILMLLTLVQVSQQPPGLGSEPPTPLTLSLVAMVTMAGPVSGTNQSKMASVLQSEKRTL